MRQFARSREGCLLSIAGFGGAALVVVLVSMREAGPVAVGGGIVFVALVWAAVQLLRIHHHRKSEHQPEDGQGTPAKTDSAILPFKGGPPRPPA